MKAEGLCVLHSVDHQGDDLEHSSNRARRPPVTLRKPIIWAPQRAEKEGMKQLPRLMSLQRSRVTAIISRVHEDLAAIRVIDALFECIFSKSRTFGSDAPSVWLQPATSMMKMVKVLNKSRTGSTCSACMPGCSQHGQGQPATDNSEEISQMIFYADSFYFYFFMLILYHAALLKL